MLLFAACCAMPDADAADGNQLFAIGAVQKSLGGAGVASPQDATWVLLNPAALIDLDRRVDVFLELMYTRPVSHPRGFPMAANPFAGEMRDSRLIALPSFAAVWPAGRGTWGLGALALQGSRVDFPHARSTVGALWNDDRRLDYQVVGFPLAYSHPLTTRLAIGGAVMPVYTRFRSDSITPDVQQSQHGNSWDHGLGIGFVLGVYYRAPRWGLGASYTTRTWVQSYDKYKGDLLRWSLDLPPKLQVGAAWQVHPRLEMVVDYKHIDWKAVPVYGRDPISGGLNWNNQHLVKAGLTWQAGEKLRLRAGVSHGAAPISKRTTFINALGPSISRTHLAAGFSYDLGKRATIHASFVHALPETLEDNGRGGIYSFLGQGTRIHYKENSLTVQYSHRF